MFSFKIFNNQTIFIAPYKSFIWIKGDKILSLFIDNDDGSLKITEIIFYLP